MPKPIQQRFPELFATPIVSKWLSMQIQIGLASTTVDAYANALRDYLSFCKKNLIDYNTVTQEHIATYVHDLHKRPVKKSLNVIQIGLSNATMLQRITTLRLLYKFMVDMGFRDANPIKTGIHTPGKGFGINRRGLLPHYQKLPWIPNEEEWKKIIDSMKTESLRNRLMLALAYEAGLRREELCSLYVSDIDPAHRLITLRAETTKGKKGRVIPYSSRTSELYVSYLQQRRFMSRSSGPLFLSESRRNRTEPISKWSWSKIIHSLAERSGVIKLTTHTLRHLCLTDLARAGWELHEISTFAGHKSIDTTLVYIHLSGRELAQKITKGMNSIHAWRITSIHNLS